MRRPYFARVSLLPDHKDLKLNPDCALPKVDLELLRDIVREAGNIAKAAFIANDSKAWNKSDSSPVTEADIAVNDFLEAKLMAARPDYGWLSEETRDDHSRHACPRSFVVDPIDGTRAFIDRTPHFVVSVAIIEKGRSIAGVIYNPMLDETYSAYIGGGAYLNDAPIHVSSAGKIKDIHMVGYPRKFRRLNFPNMDVSVVNSMAYRMCMVASGIADATVTFTPKSDWDVAAATLIITEAGGVVTDLYGKDPHFDSETTSGKGVICAGPTLHALLVHEVKPHLDEFSEGRDYKFLGTRMSDRKNTDGMKSIQLLHLVIGGELVDLERTEFKDLTAIDFVGAYANKADAAAAWKSAAQRTVDNAHMRYFILHAHDLIDPDGDGIIG